MGNQDFRDRIKELRRVAASELVPNPRNWRRHPARQAAALRGVLEEVGYADALVCGELLLIARLDNSPTHEKRPKSACETEGGGEGVKSLRPGDGGPRRWPRARVRRLG